MGYGCVSTNSFVLVPGRWRLLVLRLFVVYNDEKRIQEQFGVCSQVEPQCSFQRTTCVMNVFRPTHMVVFRSRS